MERFDALGRDEDLEAWCAQKWMLSANHMPGCLGSRKLLAAAGSPKHAVLFEFVSLATRESQIVLLEEPSWTSQLERDLWEQPGSPFVGKRIWPPV
jgi:hypothetical protein